MQFGHVHEKVSHNGLTERISHLVEFLKTAVHPFGAIRPVPDLLFAVVLFPKVKTRFSVSPVFFLRQIRLEKGVVSCAHNGQLIECIPVIVAHAWFSNVSKRPMSVCDRAIVVAILVSEVGMPENKFDEIGYLAFAQFVFPPVEERRVRSVQ